MNCPTCKNKTVENSALGKKFQYCQSCKVEVSEEVKVENKFTCCSECGTVINGSYIYPLTPTCDWCFSRTFGKFQD